MWKQAGELKNETLNAYVSDLEPDFRMLTIIPTDMCNYRCNMCHIWGENGWALQEPQKVIKEQLDVNKLIQFIESILQYKKRFNVMISGGEPLLYPQIFKLLEFLKQKRIPVLLLTNGSLLKKYSEYMLNYVTALSISLDGSEAYHDSIRGENSFHTVCEGIETIVAMKKENRSFFPLININTVLSKYSYKGVDEFVHALEERLQDISIGLEDSKVAFTMKPKDITISFEPLLFATVERGQQYEGIMKEHLDCQVTSSWRGFVEEDMGMDTSWLKEHLENIWQSKGVDYSGFVDVKDYLDDIHNTFGRTRCIAPWHELVIRKNGDAYFCNDFPDYEIGSIMDSDFEKIWYGDRANKFRNLMKNGLLPICNRCCRLFMDYNFI